MLCVVGIFYIGFFRFVQIQYKNFKHDTICKFALSVI